MTKASLEEGGALLPAAERERIARTHAKEFPEVWRGLVDDLGDEAESEMLVVAGAIVAALGEAPAVEPMALALIEAREDLRADPAEVLALALDPTDLWSIAEATVTDDALAQIPEVLDDDAYEVVWTATIEAEATRHWSPRHERRLVRLVNRVRAQLPVAAPSGTASVAIAEACCAALERDPEVRPRLAALLLADSVSLLRATGIPPAVAA